MPETGTYAARSRSDFLIGDMQAISAARRAALDLDQGSMITLKKASKINAREYSFGERSPPEYCPLKRHFMSKNRYLQAHFCDILACRVFIGHCIECHLNTTAAARALRDGAMMKSYRMEMHAKVLL